MAAKFGIDPIIVMKRWPAWVKARARFWLSARNQSDRDRAENDEAMREAGLM